MEGYKKVIFRDHQGNILLGQTHADMISETSDRRFVDNIEKTFLGRWGGNLDVADMLILNSEALRALATQEPTLTRLIDTFPSNFEEKMMVIDDLLPLTGYTQDLIESLGAMPVAYSETSKRAYTIMVDDTGSEPKLILIQQEVQTMQPEDYVIGDEWRVSSSSPDVLITLQPDAIAAYTGRKTVLTFDEGMALPMVSQEVYDNIVNGVQNEAITSKDDNIPQYFAGFDVRNSLEALFTTPGLEKTISGFTLGVLSQPMGSTTRTVTQSYMNGNVIQPAREATKKDDYTTNVFQHLTWTNSLNPEFVAEWLNNKGQAGVVTFGDINTSIAIAKPTLEVYITNPYKGKTLVATKDMGDRFNILDWEIKS